MSNKIVSSNNVVTSYIFNILTDSKYNNTKFQGLLIDSGVSTQLKKKIGQLKAL